MKIYGIKRTFGTFKGHAFDKVNIITGEHKTFADNPVIIEKEQDKTTIYGDYLRLSDNKMKTAYALDLFGVDTPEELAQFIGQEVTCYYNCYGSLVSITVGGDE